MLLRAASSFSLLNCHGDRLAPLVPSVSSSSSYSILPLNSPVSLSSSILRFSPARNGVGCVVCATKGANNRPLSGVIFEPFEEVKKELNLVPSVPDVSLARQKYANGCEFAINEQIK